MSNKPVLGNTLDYYNDDMSRRAVGKLFDDLDELVEESKLSPSEDKFTDTSSIVSGYADVFSKIKGHLEPEPAHEPEPVPAEFPRDPAMERAIERAAEMAIGQPESEAETALPPRGRTFVDGAYDMGMYRRGNSFINNEEYEELIRPQKRMHNAEHSIEDDPEPAIIHRTPLKGSSPKGSSPTPPRYRPTQSDSDKYLERAQVQRDQNEMKSAANAYHRSRVLRPYIMGLFVIMMMAMMLMLFRIIALDDRVKKAEAGQEEMLQTMESYMPMQLENASLKEEIVKLEMENERLQASQASAGPPEPGASDQPALPSDGIEFPTEYIVADGDNLSKISNKFYGSPVHYPKIKEANGMTSDAVTPGQRLIIPEL